MKIDPPITSTPSSAPALGGGVRGAQGEASTQGASAPATSSASTSSNASGSASAASQGSAAQSSVNLSSLSTQLRSIGAGFGSASGDIDAKRVSEIKDAISKGNLSIDPSKIADGLIETVRGLLQNPQSQA